MVGLGLPIAVHVRLCDISEDNERTSTLPSQAPSGNEMICAGPTKENKSQS